MDLEGAGEELTIEFGVNGGFFLERMKLHKRWIYMLSLIICSSLQDRVLFTAGWGTRWENVKDRSTLT
jgi:hypothetical protein